MADLIIQSRGIPGRAWAIARGEAIRYDEDRVEKKVFTVIAFTHITFAVATSLMLGAESITTIAFSKGWFSPAYLYLSK